MLRRALQVVAAKLATGVCGLQGLESLRSCLLDRLSGRWPLAIHCSDCGGLPADGFTPKGQSMVGICRGTFEGGQDRVNAVLFHELIHTCGGEEMDGEGLECHCFAGQGATMPGRSDFTLFEKRQSANGYYAGRYLLWHPATGQVYVSNGPGVPGAPLGVRFERR
jgi:hypothetical protein